MQESILKLLVLIDQLENDHESSDEELINFVAIESDLPIDKIRECVTRERSAFLKGAYTFSSHETYLNLLMPYFKE